MINSSKGPKHRKLMINREILIHLASKQFAKIRGGVDNSGNTNIGTVTSNDVMCDTSMSDQATECDC